MVEDWSELSEGQHLDSLRLDKIRVNYEAGMAAKQEGDQALARDRLQVAVSEIQSYRRDLGRTLVTDIENADSKPVTAEVRGELRKLELGLEQEIGALDQSE